MSELARLEGVKKTYRGRPVLDLPQLTLEAGRRYALIGANGSGKSTLLRLLAGAISPNAGRISFSFPPEAGAVGYLPQKPYPFSLTVLDSLLLALPRDGRSREQREQEARQRLAQVGLAGFEQMRGHRLSGGEGQRLALARLLLAPHRLLLLDEPTASTDIAGNDLVEAALSEYLSGAGATLVLATHSPSQALRLADTVLLLEAGRLIESGPAQQVLEHPRSEGGLRFLRYWRG